MPFSDPVSNIAQFEIGAGDIIADLGAGSGFYTLAAAHATGSTGKVYAVEVQKDLLDRIKNSATSDGLHNVEIIWGDIEEHGGTRLRDSSVDKVILSNVLFQADEKMSVINEIMRILKPAGKTLFIEWSDSSSVSGPDRSHLIPEHEARALFERAGFSIARTIQAGKHHYGFIAEKP